MIFAIDIVELSDDNLLARAKEWRLKALRGDKDARGIAHELEREVRRRFPPNVALQALPRVPLLSTVQQSTIRRWKTW